MHDDADLLTPADIKAQGAGADAASERVYLRCYARRKPRAPPDDTLITSTGGALARDWPNTERDAA